MSTNKAYFLIPRHIVRVGTEYTSNPSAGDLFRPFWFRQSTRSVSEKLKAEAKVVFNLYLFIE